MYKINFNHLYYFLTIAREGSIVKASKKLHITQPALSHQLKILEDDLGKKLFDRIGKRLRINHHGESVKEYANKIFRYSEEMIEFVNSSNHESIKIVKVGTVPWVPKELVYKFIKKLIYNPNIKVQVYHQDNIESLLDHVLSDRLDVLLCDSSYSGRFKRLQGHLLSEDPIVCVSTNKVEFKGKFPQNLEGKKMICYSTSCQVMDSIDNFLKTNQINANIVGEISDISLMSHVLESTGVVGFLPQSVLKNSSLKNVFLKLGSLEEYTYDLWAITRKNYHRDGIISSLITDYKKN